MSNDGASGDEVNPTDDILTYAETKDKNASEEITFRIGITDDFRKKIKVYQGKSSNTEAWCHTYIMFTNFKTEWNVVTPAQTFALHRALHLNDNAQQAWESILLDIE